MAQTTLSEQLRRVEGEIAARRPDAALALCQQLVERHPRALAVQRTLGEIYLSLRKPREALGALDRALAGDPEDARACCARAVVHQMHGDSLMALAWYRRACDIRPDDDVLLRTYQELAAHMGQRPYEPTRVGLARLYVRGDLLPHAIREWESLIAANPDLLEAHVGLAESLWRAGRIADAEERCRRILANSPSCLKPTLLLAVIALDRGQHDEAARLATRAAELDPDHRIARGLFIDRLGAHDAALGTLLFGPDAAVFPGPRTGALPLQPVPGAADQQRPRQGVSRPLVGSQALTGRMTAGPLAQDGAGAFPQGFTPSSATTPTLRGTLPKDKVFSETEYMIWGPDDDPTPTRPRQAVRPEQQPAPADASPEPFARSAQFVPPAIRAHGATLDDTEARAAITWVQWLQAQGARALEGPATGALGAIPVMRPTTGALVPPAAAVPPTRTPASAPVPPPVTTPSPRVTTPLMPPTPEALRTMFAELDGPATQGEIAAAPARPADAQRHTGPLADLARATAAFGDGPAAPVPQASGHATGAPITLESLEHGFAASGFSTFEPHAGALAELAAGAPAAAPAAAPAEGPASAAASSVGVATLAAESAAPAEAAPPPEPEVVVPSRPAHDDYPARLQFARERRDAGEIDDALNEYGALLKFAPDLLDDVMSDLNAALDETPEHPELHRLLGDARIRAGDYLSALESYNRAVALTQARDG